MADECVQATPTNHTHQIRIVERDGRRRRRRESRREAGVTGHYEGQSSDDEILETNRIRFKNEIGRYCYVICHLFILTSTPE